MLCDIFILIWSNCCYTRASNMIFLWPKFSLSSESLLCEQLCLFSQISKLLILKVGLWEICPKSILVSTMIAWFVKNALSLSPPCWLQFLLWLEGMDLKGVGENNSKFDNFFTFVGTWNVSVKIITNSIIYFNFCRHNMDSILWNLPLFSVV